MPETVESIPFLGNDGVEILIQIRCSKIAKHMTLRIHNGTFRLTVPQDATIPDMEDTLQSMREWIEKKRKQHLLEQKRRMLPASILIPLQSTWFQVTGVYSQIPLNPMLRSCAISVQGKNSVMYYLEAQSMLTIFGDLNDLDLVMLTLQTWARQKAADLLPRYLKHLAALNGFRLKNVGIRDQKSRWGSCSKGRHGLYNISLNWRAVLLPLHLLRELCHHELCHTKHMNHSHAFHAEINRLEPRAEEYEKELTKISTAMPWWTEHIRS